MKTSETMNIKSIFGKYFVLTVGLLLSLTLGSCHSSKKATKESSKEHVEIVKVESGKEKKGKGIKGKIVKEALSWQGTPYKYAGTSKGKGTDCSGMVWTIYQDVANMKIPRNSLKQAEFCEKIGKKSVTPGDLVFFATGKDKKKISHVGIMIDKERFVHASTKKGVIISDMTTPYYQRTFIMYGRAL